MRALLRISSNSERRVKVVNSESGIFAFSDSTAVVSAAGPQEPLDDCVGIILLPASNKFPSSPKGIGLNEA